MAMQEVDKNIAIKPVSEPVRAAACQFEASAVAGGRKGEGLYFPVSLDDGTTVAGPNGAADGDALERGACISLLIPEIGPPLPKVRGNVSEGVGLYFPVNSRTRRRARSAHRCGKGAAPEFTDRCRFKAAREIHHPQKVSFAARNRGVCLNILQCTIFMPRRPRSGHQLTAVSQKCDIYQ
jgi:hypothetical protein